MKKLNLLQQALIEEKRLKLNDVQSKLKHASNNYQLLKVLLPKYEPQPKQKLFHKSNAYEKGLKGGYGSGKTLPLCAEAIALAYINRPLSVIISSPSEEAIKHTTYETLKHLLQDNNIEFEWIETKGHFKIFFGQNEKEHGNIFLIGQIFFKGPNVAAVGFDEPFSQKKETYDNLIARVRNPKAKRLEVFWAGTAEPGKMDWGFEYFERNSNTSDLFTITLPTRENKFLPKDFIEGLKKKYSAKLQEVYLEGKLVLLTSSPVYYAFDRASLVSHFDKLSVTGDMILGFDFNVDPMTAVLIIFEKRSKIFYQIREWSLSNSNTKELCAAIISYLVSGNALTPALSHGEREKSIIITGDATARKRGTRGYLSDYEIIRDEFIKANINFHFNVPQENPAVRDRVNYVNALFEQRRFFIDESCVKSIKDRELVSWKNSAEGFMIDKSKKDLTHLSDAADYALFNCQVLAESEDKERGVVMMQRALR